MSRACRPVGSRVPVGIPQIPPSCAAWQAPLGSRHSVHRRPLPRCVASAIRSGNWFRRIVMSHPSILVRIYRSLVLGVTIRPNGNGRLGKNAHAVRSRCHFCAAARAVRAVRAEEKGRRAAVNRRTPMMTSKNDLAENLRAEILGSLKPSPAEQEQSSNRASGSTRGRMLGRSLEPKN
jgi:hypothetical protein